MALVREYRATITIAGINGTTATTLSTVIDSENNLRKVFDEAMRQSFDQLLSGGATYGQPGKGTCQGPYTIQKIEITLHRQEN